MIYSYIKSIKYELHKDIIPLSGAGANPVNMSYVNGIRSRSPLILMHEDALVTGQTIYDGITDFFCVGISCGQKMKAAD